MVCYDVILFWLNGIFWLYKDLFDLNVEFELFLDVRGVFRIGVM